MVPRQGTSPRSATPSGARPRPGRSLEGGADTSSPGHRCSELVQGDGPERMITSSPTAARARRSIAGSIWSGRPKGASPYSVSSERSSCYPQGRRRRLAPQHAPLRRAGGTLQVAFAPARVVVARTVASIRTRAGDRRHRGWWSSLTAPRADRRGGPRVGGTGSSQRGARRSLSFSG